MWRLALPAFTAAVLAPLMIAQWGASDANAATPCPSPYPPRAHLADVKARIAALHLIERETADRTAGLDTRPYEWLLEQARAGEKAISVQEHLVAEDELVKRCLVKPLRTTCAVGSAALVRVIADLQAGRDPNEAKMAYAQTMPKCETIVGVKPPQTSLRTYRSPPLDTDIKRLDPPPIAR